MKIDQLSDKLDEKLADVDTRIKQLTDPNRQSPAERSSHSAEELAALQGIREKLLKSKEVVWRAHKLQQESGDNRQLRRVNRIGLILCIASVVAIVLIIGATLWSALR